MLRPWVKAVLEGVGRALLVVAAASVLTYAADDLRARFRGKPTEKVKVYLIYLTMNRWNEVEYSRGNPVMETCVDALMPHFGHLPCWYLRKHDMRQIGNP